MYFVASIVIPVLLITGLAILVTPRASNAVGVTLSAVGYLPVLVYAFTQSNSDVLWLPSLIVFIGLLIATAQWKTGKSQTHTGSRSKKPAPPNSALAVILEKVSVGCLLGAGAGAVLTVLLSINATGARLEHALFALCCWVSALLTLRQQRRLALGFALLPLVRVAKLFEKTEAWPTAGAIVLWVLALALSANLHYWKAQYIPRSRVIADS